MDPKSHEFQSIPLQKIEVILKKVLISLLIFLYVLVVLLLGLLRFPNFTCSVGRNRNGIDCCNHDIYLILLAVCQFSLRIFPRLKKTEDS
jgi:hypothetical protein